MVMIFAAGHIPEGTSIRLLRWGSGCAGTARTKDVAPYITFQIMGGVLAALVVKFLKGGALLHPSSRRLYPRFWQNFFSPLLSFTP
jgi:hypothetical protein